MNECLCEEKSIMCVYYIQGSYGHEKPGKVMEF